MESQNYTLRKHKVIGDASTYKIDYAGVLIQTFNSANMPDLEALWKTLRTEERGVKGLSLFKENRNGDSYDASNADTWDITFKKLELSDSFKLMTDFVLKPEFFTDKVYGIRMIDRYTDIWMDEKDTELEEKICKAYNIKTHAWNEHFGQMIDGSLVIERSQDDQVGAIYLGNKNSALNVDDFLEKNNIGSMLSIYDEKDVLEKIEAVAKEKGINWKCLIRKDDERFFKIAEDLPEIMEWIDLQRKDLGKNVLIHCKGGISRSPSTLIAYLMVTENKSLQETSEFVKEKRNCIRLNKFMSQLQEIELNREKLKPKIENLATDEIADI